MDMDEKAHFTSTSNTFIVHSTAFSRFSGREYYTSWTARDSYLVISTRSTHRREFAHRTWSAQDMFRLRKPPKDKGGGTDLTIGPVVRRYEAEQLPCTGKSSYACRL